LFKKCFISLSSISDIINHCLTDSLSDVLILVFFCLLGQLIRVMGRIGMSKRDKEKDKDKDNNNSKNDKDNDIE